MQLQLAALVPYDAAGETHGVQTASLAIPHAFDRYVPGWHTVQATHLGSAVVPSQ